MVALAVQLAALSIDPLHGGNAGQGPISALCNCVELQPRNVVRVGAGRITNNLTDNRAAVGQFPVWTGIVATDGSAISNECRNRFAKLPDELGISAGFAFIDLRALGMNFQ